MKTVFYRYAIVLALASSGYPVFAAALSLSPAITQIETDEIRIPVSLATLGPDKVAALQFDLNYDTHKLTYSQIEAGAAAKTGEKSTHANLVRPGQLRIIVAGLNQNALPEGPVAWIAFRRQMGPRTLLTVHLNNAVLSDPYGNAVAVQLTPDTLSVDSESAQVIASVRGNSNPTQRGMDALVRYRALLFAGVVVGLGVVMTRRKPRKGRVR